MSKPPGPRAPLRVALDVRGMLGIDDLFTVSGGTRRDPAIDAWFAQRAGPLRQIAQGWFTCLRERGEDVVELLHDGCPVACVDDAPFAYVNSFAAHVNVGFFQGAALPDPAGLLEGKGKRIRHVKLRPGEDVDAAALEALIDAAYADIRQRLGQR